MPKLIHWARESNVSTFVKAQMGEFKERLVTKEAACILSTAAQVTQWMFQ